jgi:hypothetical protein
MEVCFLLASNERRGGGERFLLSPFFKWKFVFSWLPMRQDEKEKGEGEKFLFFFPLSKEPYLYLSSLRKRRKTIRKKRGR